MKELIVLFFTILTFQMSAQEIVGDWNGKISYQGIELRLVFHITADSGKYQSTMDSPDQGAAGIAVAKTTFENGKLTIAANDIGMEYTAELDTNGKTLTGTFNQQGVTLPLVMTKEGEKQSLINHNGIGSATKVLGDWNGILDISGTQLLIVFHVMELDGNLKSTMDSPDQGTNGIPMNETTFADGKLKIVAHALNADYTAELSEEGAMLKGVFKQNGGSWDLNMTKEKVKKKQ